tara:strand:- start:126 stop:329 length:204 start_codon:yes stop_codon:yes gene_type:complete
MKFEKSIKRLEEILKKIDNTDLSLDELLNLFEEGNKVATDCQQKIKDAKIKVKTILDENNESIKEDL